MLDGLEPPDGRTSETARSVLAAIFQCWPEARFDPSDRLGVWTYATSDLEPDQVRHGIRRCVREGGEYPPSPGIFRDWCLERPAGTYQPAHFEGCCCPECKAWRRAHR